MIDINLVPPELRKKQKKGFILAGMKIPPEVVVGSIGGLFMVLIFVHISLLFINITKLAQRNHLQKSIDQIGAGKEKVDGVISNLRMTKNSYDNLIKLTTDRKIMWSKKLSALSERLPRGVWFKRVALSDKVFFIEGSAISSEQNEMFNVHTFISNLKNDGDFLSDFNELELGSIQRRSIQKIDIADFLITTKLK